MPAFLLNFAAGIVGPRFAKAAVIGTGVMLLLLAIFVAVKLHDRRVIRDHQTKTERRAMPATDKAAAERAANAIANAKTEQEMHDAIAAQPDQPISPTSRALACQRLRHAGKHPAACS